MYLLMAIIAVVVSFSVAGAWFIDRDTVDSTMDMGGAVIVKLVGTGEDGTIQNFKQLYDSDGGAYPGDKILDSIKVQMDEKTEESVLRVQYSVDILDKEKNVKTQDLTEAETKLSTLLKNDLRAKTTLYSSDWAQTSSDWIYYKHLASGKTKPIDLFDEYSLPLPDSEMDNQYQELSFRISLVAEAIQAANIMSHNEWNDDITNLSDSALMERVIKYNGERFAEVDEVLPYIETTGGQYIDTGYAANLNTAVEVTFQTNSGNKWLFGSRTSGGASNTYAVHVSSMNSIWFQMANDSSSTQFSVGNFTNKQSTITVNKDAAYFNGVQIGTVGRTSFGENTLSLYLGVINANGSGTDRPFVGKIYSSRIWDNGELVRFFVPARDKNGNVGFYDLVTHQMFLNAGTGNFAYGHSINYIANGGTIATNAPKTFVSGDLPITLPVPTRAGYEFGGWFLSSDFSGAAQTTIPAGTNNNVYVYAKWIKTYNITYHLGGGINAEDNPTEFNERTLPLTLKAPTRDGFTFGGWYQNPAYSGNQMTTIDAGTEKNVSLWAKWNAIEYSVSYVLNGGTNSDQNVAKYSILDTPVKLYNPTRDGYLFEGWFASSDFSGERMTYLSKDNLGDVTLHAKWSLAYTITYNTNGGFNDGRNPSVFTENTETFTLFGAEKVNYSFLGWFDNEELTGTPITQIAKGTKNNIVLWAKWSSTQITVTFNPNGGGVSPLTKVVKKGGTYGELPAPTKAGYTFNGWGFAMPLSVGANTVRQDDYTIKSGAANADTYFWVNQNYHLTIGNQYVVKFYAIVDPNNNWRLSPQNRTPEFSLKNGYNEVTFVAGDSRGFFFDDKNRDPDHPFIITDVIIEAQTEGEVITFSTTKYVNSETQITLENNHTLFAQWTENVYTVTYNLDGGTNAAGNPATFKCSNLPIALLDATKDGEYFAGWYLDAEFTKRVTKIDAGSLKNIELWARFSQSPLVFDLVGSSAYSVRAANTSISGNIEIPQTYNGKPVVVIQNSAFKDCSNVTSVLIPNSIKSIGINAFENCSNITETTIPEGVTLIGNNTFLGCEKLASVTFPTSLENIGANAFAGCTSLTSIVLPKNIQEIGANAFANCSTLSTIEVFGDTPATLKTGVFPSSVSKIYVKPSLVATYKAAWAEYKDKIVGFTEHSITYNLNGGTNSAKNISSFTKIDVPIKLYDPTKENADFLGWYATSDFSGENVTEITTASNVTLYARWDRKMTITYVLNGGINSSANLSTITESMLPYSLMPASKQGYAFVGWFIDEGLSEQTTAISAFGDITIYAAWEWVDPNLVFTLNSDGTAYSVKAKSTNISGQISIPATFKGKPVNEIEANAFENCSKITDIFFTSSIQTIGSSAFYNTEIITYTNASSGANICEVKGLPVTSGSWKYAEKLDNSLIIVKYLGSSSTVSVPNFLNEKIVKNIHSYCFSSKDKIQSITIPNSVISIGSGAFSGCNGLTKVNITDLAAWFKITFDNEYANPLNYAHHLYLNNTELTEITIPNSITKINNYALCGASLIARVYIPSSVTTIAASSAYYSPFYGWNNSAVIFCEAESKPDAWGSFWNYNSSNTQLTVVWRANESQQNDDWIYIEKTNGTINLVRYIGSATNIFVPSLIGGKSVAEISDKCFIDQATITQVTIPDSVTSIGFGAFSGCNWLTSLTIPFINNYLGYMFGASSYSDNSSFIPGSLKTIIVTGGTSIASDAFSGCSGLTSITLPNGLTSIEGSAFSGCSGLTSITIPNSVISIGSSAFSGCSGLTSITIPNGLTNIESSVFSGCSGLTSITIPSSVTSIGSGAFSGCNGLTSITIPNSVTSIGESVFRNCTSLENLTIPFVGHSSTSTGFQGVFGYIFGYTTRTANSGYGSSSSSFTTLTTGSVENAVCSWTDTTYSYRVKTGFLKYTTYYGLHSYWYYIPSSLKNVTVTGGNINTAAFCRVPNMSVTINGAESINSYAFYNSQVTSITIPSTVKNIYDYAFYGCAELKSIIIDAANQTYKNVNNIILTKDGKTVIQGFNCSGVIPNGVTSIGSSAFSGCSELTSITIPDGVTSIGSSAFLGCSGLTSITISNSVTSIGSRAFNNCSLMRKIYIPISVTTISASSYSDSPFYGWNSTAIIYCGASSKPSGWGSNWKYYASDKALTVNWGASGLPA